MPTGAAASTLTPMDFLSNAFATLLVTVDPPAIAPMFLALTVGMTGAERRQVAWRAALFR